MVVYKRGIERGFGIFMLFLTIFVSYPQIKVHAHAAERKKVLILNSYHEGDIWEESLGASLKNEISKSYKDIEILTEYMDMRKYSGPVYFKKLYDIYNYKYKHMEQKPDLIIACDNDALNFLNQYHHGLFSDIPVVFVGINNFNASMIGNRELFTGVAEEVDVKGTLDIALKLHKGVEEIQVVIDFSETGNQNRKIIEELIPDYHNIAKINFLQSNYLSDINHNLANIKKNSIIFALGSFKDDKGQIVPVNRCVSEIGKFTSLPIYSSWDFLLGQGIVGGVITKAERQGELAAQIATRILNGEKPVQIPVVRDNPNRYWFDYNKLKEFKIKGSQLPSNSVIINRPFFYYNLAGDFVWCAVVILAVLLIVGSIVLFFSINSRRRLKKALTKKSEHFKKRAEENRMLYTEVIEYDKLKTEFFANISHELRTPLNVLLSMLQLLDLHLRNGDIVFNNLDVDKKVYIMKQNCFRLLRLVNNLIDITKIDSGFFQLQLQNRNIIAVIEEITLSVADYIENKGIELIFDTEIEEVEIACDADKIERIMLNMLSNSVKFTPAGGSIFVNIKNEGSILTVSVRDSGIGIPEDKMQYIFERFRQVDKSLSRNREGSGIGLSLVKALVELHGGRVWVESEYGKGSTFTFQLPVKLTEVQNQSIDRNIQVGHIERINVEFSDIYL
jgi:signal transduction histidine kinase